MAEQASPLRVFAAGSLRAAVTALAAEIGGTAPELVFGPAGLLRERIEAGDVPGLFLSANLAHPARLAESRPGAVVQVFARNTLVALARPELGLTTENFLDCLLQDDVRIGTSTPVLDPSGDYAHALFARADRLQPGARALLAGRATALVGGRDTAPAAAGSYPALAFLKAGTVDVFLTYLSNARTMADLFDVVIPPAALTVAAEYGLIVLADGPAAAFAGEILSPRGRALLARHGFQAP